MKNFYLIIILFSIQSYSQNEKWFDFELDSITKFKLPAENANLFNSEENGIKMYELSAEKNGIVYSGNKMLITKSRLPNNLDELKSIYDEAIPNISKNYPKTIVSKESIEKNGFKGQKLTLTDSIGNRLYQSEVYLLNNSLFLFNCISKDDSDIKEAEYFFNHISLPTNSSIIQLTEKSNSLKFISRFKTELMILIGILGLIIGIIVLKKNVAQHSI